MNIVWFRQDLRIADNPALNAAVAAGDILPVYILDDVNAGSQKAGAASRLWLHHSLRDLNASLRGNLHFFAGDAGAVIGRLCSENNVHGVYWNRCYEPWRIAGDKKIKQQLEMRGVAVKSFNASLLWEPWEVLKQDGTPYRVFTPFFNRGCANAQPPRAPVAAPKNIAFADLDTQSQTLEQLELLPHSAWHKTVASHWDISEAGARHALATFCQTGLANYREGRNFPAGQSVSRLSPYLHAGQISPNRIWFEIEKREQTKNSDHFKSELGWREFAHSLLYHFPRLPDANLRAKFDKFPWRENAGYLQAWQHGQTGYPIVDAGMRELWQTGYMHNRVRMLAGSFLVKNLLQHWRSGAAWFWDCLVDADLANNSAGWQWVAGCGADAAPYFRIFNPVSQGEKFDPQGAYTRRFVPELAGLPDKYLFRPWQAPQAVLAEANIRLGRDYPEPIVSLRASREAALSAYRGISAS